MDITPNTDGQPQQNISSVIDSSDVPKDVDANIIPDKTAFTRKDVEKAISDALAKRGRDLATIREAITAEVDANYATQVAELTNKLANFEEENTAILADVSSENEQLLKTISAHIPVEKAHVMESITAYTEHLNPLEVRKYLRTYSDMVGMPKKAEIKLPKVPKNSVGASLPQSVADKIAGSL